MHSPVTPVEGEHPPSLQETYDAFAKQVPEHIQQLLADTIQQLEGEKEEEKKAITLLLIAYQDLFEKDETNIGKTDS